MRPLEYLRQETTSQLNRSERKVRVCGWDQIYQLIQLTVLTQNFREETGIFKFAEHILETTNNELAYDVDQIRLRRRVHQ